MLWRRTLRARRPRNPVTMTPPAFSRLRASAIEGEAIVHLWRIRALDVELAALMKGAAPSCFNGDFSRRWPTPPTVSASDMAVTPVASTAAASVAKAVSASLFAFSSRASAAAMILAATALSSSAAAAAVPSPRSAERGEAPATELGLDVQPERTPTPASAAPLGLSLGATCLALPKTLPMAFEVGDPSCALDGAGPATAPCMRRQASTPKAATEIASRSLHALKLRDELARLGLTMRLCKEAAVFSPRTSNELGVVTEEYGRLGGTRAVNSSSRARREAVGGSVSPASRSVDAAPQAQRICG